MVIELILLAAALVYCIYYTTRILHMVKCTKNIQSEKAYPLIGHLYLILKRLGNPGYSVGTDMLDFVIIYLNKYREQGLTKFWFGPTLFVALWDPAYIEEMVNNPHVMNKGPFYYMLFGDISHGVFVAETGMRWKELRRPLTKSFSKKLIDSKYHNIFVNRSYNLAQYISQQKTTIQFDVQKKIYESLLASFTDTHIGVPNDEVIADRFNVLENFEEFFNANMHNIQKCHFYFKRVGEYCTELGKELRKRKTNLDRYFQWILDERQKIKEDCKDDIGPFGVEYYSDFLLRRCAEKKIPMHEIRKELGDIIIAACPKDGVLTSRVLVSEVPDMEPVSSVFTKRQGSDTTKSVTSNALAFLAMFPDIQEKAYQEQISIFGDTDRKPSSDDLASMVFLKMIVLETLRISGAPGFFRQVSKDIKIDKYIIPKGANLYISALAAHTDPRYWEKPKSFYPEHFLPEKEAERPRYAFVPFGLSPRMCPGFQYGINAVMVLLSTLLRHFEVQTSMKFEEIIFEYKLLLELPNYDVKFIKRIKD